MVLGNPPGGRLVIFILANVQKVKDKYGKLPAKVAEEVSCNRILVDLIYHENPLKNLHYCK